MSNEGFETRLKNILDELKAIIRESGLTKHGEIRDMLKRDLKMGSVDADVLTLFVPGYERKPTRRHILRRQSCASTDP